MAVLGVVRDAVALVCEVEASHLSAATSLAGELAVDSVSMVEIIEVTEAGLLAAGLALAFDDARLGELVTIGDIVAYVSSNSGGDFGDGLAPGCPGHGSVTG